MHGPPSGPCIHSSCDLDRFQNRCTSKTMTLSVIPFKKMTPCTISATARKFGTGLDLSVTPLMKGINILSHVGLAAIHQE